MATAAAAAASTNEWILCVLFKNVPNAKVIYRPW
jgi:hypothetical protein